MILKTIRSHIGEALTSTELIKILSDVEKFLGKPFNLVAIEKMADDPNGRIDLFVSYDEIMLQKLWIMNGEVVDGDIFHERFDEWYPKKRT